MASLSERKTQIIVAVITGVFALAGTILMWVLKSDDKKPDDKKTYSGRVMEKDSDAKKIKGAKVTLEAKGIPPYTYTDDNGIYSLSLSGSPESVRLRVEATGYQPFNEIVAVTEDGFKTIYLTPVAPPTPTPTQTPALTPTPGRKATNRNQSKVVNSNLLDRRLEGERRLNNYNKP